MLLFRRSDLLPQTTSGWRYFNRAGEDLADLLEVEREKLRTGRFFSSAFWSDDSQWWIMWAARGCQKTTPPQGHC